jgi:hypothetical protein
MAFINIVRRFTFFTIAATLFFSCTRIGTSALGVDFLSQDAIGTKDTVLDVETETIVLEDSLRIYPSDQHVIGDITNDPIFGTTSASLFLQLKPSFYPFYIKGTQDSIIVDSAVLVLSYKGFFGDSSKPVKTFCISFDESEFSEAKFAKIVSDKYATDHQEIRLSPDDFLKLMPGALAAMDHPSGDGPNTFVVSKVTKEAGITMALSGLGGDELFAGYDLFMRLKKIESKSWLQFVPSGMRGVGVNFLQKTKPSVSSDKLSEFLRLNKYSITSVYPLMRKVLTENKIKELLSHGDLSVLETNIHPTDEHDFDNPEKGVCVFYGRDRGEEGIDAQVTSIDEFHTNSNSSFTEFLYLFTGGNWWVYDNLEKNGWELVKKLLPDFDLTPEDLSCSISL